MPCDQCKDPARCEQVCQSLRFPLSRTDHVTSNAFIAAVCEASGEVVALVPEEGASEVNKPRTDSKPADPYGY